MRTNRLLAAVLAGSTFVAPAVYAATRECPASNVTAESYNWDFQKEANTLLNSVEQDARQIQDHAATLESFSGASEVHWQSHAAELNQIKASVNSLGDTLCRLEAIRSEMAPWQKQALKRVQTEAPLLASETEAAIGMVNNDQDRLWATPYNATVHALYENASSIGNSVSNFEHLARLRREERQLRGEIGANSGM